jgi:manganese/zinc/iron transport system permease protein
MESWLYEQLIEPWAYGSWMWRAVLSASLVGVMSAVLGCWLYLRRMSMMGDVLSHVIVLGLAVAFMITGQRDSITMLIGAAVSGVLAGGVIHQVTRWTRLKEDAAMGIVLTAFFALGVVLITSAARRVDLDADCVLFGNLLGVDDPSLSLLAAVTGLVLTLSAVFYRVLKVSSFDPAFALLLGWSVPLLQQALLATMSLAAVAAFEAVGAILVVSMLVTPAATAHLLCRSLPSMFVTAIVHSLLCATLGIYSAIWFNVNPAGSTVVVGVTLYAVAALYARLRTHRPSLLTSSSAPSASVPSHA